VLLQLLQPPVHSGVSLEALPMQRPKGTSKKDVVGIILVLLTRVTATSGPLFASRSSTLTSSCWQHRSGWVTRRATPSEFSNGWTRSSVRRILGVVWCPSTGMSD
jgi:hypothetical protein